MKLPKRIQDVINKKQEFIDAARSKMESSVIKLQTKLLNEIVTNIIPELETKDGLIIESPKNYRLISALDKTYSDFQQATTKTILPQITSGTGEISKQSANYFNVMLGSDLPGKFDKIVSTADKLINMRLGLEGGKLVRGGYLQSFFDSNNLGTELKQMTSKAVTSGMDMKEYITMLSDKITGSEEYTGGLERQFQRYAYDLYQQYDASYNQTLGNEFGFRYFIYQGGLVKDSRVFCVEHNNKVWSVEEAQDWATWKDPTTGQVPSYLGYPGYSPLIDRGGYNCRHSLGWISDELAYEMRPELKE